MATRSKTEGTLAATLGSRERERATVTMSVKLHVHHVPVGDPLFEVLLGSVGGPDKVGTVSGMSDNDTLVALVHRCPHLKCIDLTESGEDITDSALMVVAVDCHGLEVLVLNNSSAITDDGLLAVVRNCRHLRTVLIKFCPNISSDMPDIIASVNPNVTVTMTGPLRYESAHAFGSARIEIHGEGSPMLAAAPMTRQLHGFLWNSDEVSPSQQPQPLQQRQSTLGGRRQRLCPS